MRELIGQTYDADSITSTGYRVELAQTKGDGWAVVLTDRSRWQGSRSGDEHWITHRAQWDHDDAKATAALIASRDHDTLQWVDGLINGHVRDDAFEVTTRRKGCVVR